MGIFKDCFGDVRRFQNEFFECSERPIMIFFCEVKYANRGIISGSIRIVSKFSDPPCFGMVFCWNQDLEKLTSKTLSIRNFNV